MTNQDLSPAELDAEGIEREADLLADVRRGLDAVA